jgi:hypothetical protein
METGVETAINYLHSVGVYLSEKKFLPCLVIQNLKLWNSPVLPYEFYFKSSMPYIN